MASSYNASVVRDGLILYYDMNNTQKSWKGMPTTNLLTYSESANTIYNLSSGSFVPDAILSPTGTMTADRINLTAGAMNSWDVYRTVSVTSGVVYTFSMYVLLGSSTNFCVVMNNTQAWDTVARQCFTSANGLNSSNWTRISLTFTGPAFGAINIHLGANYESALSASPQSGGYAYMWGTQLEVGSFATPYIPTVASTVARSTTQAIVDLTGNNAFTTTSLTYASNNTFSFNGTSDYITANTTLSTLTTAWTIETWCNVSSSQAQTYAGIWGTHNGSYTGFALQNVSTGNQWALLYGNGTTWVGWTSNNFTITPNVWQHVVCLMNSTSLLMYVNGILVATYAISGPVVPSASNFTIGLSMIGLTRWLTGSIGITRVYNRALTATEVLQNFNAQRSRYGI